jgi:hypothetical protein
MGGAPVGWNATIRARRVTCVRVREFWNRFRSAARQLAQLVRLTLTSPWEPGIGENTYLAYVFARST